MKPETDRQITIEDLLHLKRAEVPPAEFWSTFDRELRAKQLTALLPKRRWWQAVPKALWSLPRSRYRVPLGASAVLAITFFSVRENEAPVATQQVAVASPALNLDSSAPLAVATTEVAPAPLVEVEAPAMPLVAAPESAPAIVAASSLPVTPTGGGAGEPVDSPAARRIAANLAAVQSPEALNSRTLLAATNGFEARVMPPRTAVEPLQQMTPPSDTRRSRLLTAMVSNASFDPSTHTSARAASRIEEERLYDQIQRFGARGDRVQMKF
jgi:hypothetical protein